MNINGLKFRSFIAPAVIAAGLLTATGAGAQGIIIDQGGVRIAPPPQLEERVAPPPRWDNDRYDERAERGIGPREARRIARGAGIVETYGVDRRGRVWVVEGADRRGNAVRVTISARSGDILDVDRARRG